VPDPARGRPLDRRSSLARAKRTERTEARRRHRSEQGAIAGDADGAVAVAPSASTRTAPAKNAPAPERPSIMGALRGAVRPVDLSGDVRALPQLLVHWSFWGPAAATIVTTVLYIALSQGRTSATPSDTVWVLVNLAFQMFVFPLPAPAGAAFIAGFGARRASWLVGLLIGILSAICFAVIVNSVSTSLTSSDPSANVQSFVLQGFLVAPIGAALFAAAAAWYKRFLNLANPNRNQRRAQQQKPVKGRGDITRDRLSH
jgi:hypothetical protein